MALPRWLGVAQPLKQPAYGHAHLILGFPLDVAEDVLAVGAAMETPRSGIRPDATDIVVSLTGLNAPMALAAVMRLPRLPDDLPVGFSVVVEVTVGHESNRFVSVANPCVGKLVHHRSNKASFSHISNL